MGVGMGMGVGWGSEAKRSDNRRIELVLRFALLKLAGFFLPLLTSQCCTFVPRVQLLVRAKRSTTGERRGSGVYISKTGEGGGGMSPGVETGGAVGFVSTLQEKAMGSDR